MAHEFLAILNKRNRVGITNAEFQVIDAAGNIVVSLSATEVVGEAIYRADMPANTPAGRYPFRLQRASNNQVLAFGEVFWDGTQALTESEYAQATLHNLSVDDLITSFDTANLATHQDVLSVASGLLSDIIANQSLPADQLATLNTIRDILEADEVLTPTTARKLHKTTGAVLVDKEVISSTECNVNTTLTEVV